MGIPIMFSIVRSNVAKPKSRHYLSTEPPGDHSSAAITPMPRAEILVVTEGSEGVFLYRYTHDGEFGGDTWHATVEDARAQASFEYGLQAEAWVGIPIGTEDGLAFAQAQLSSESSS